MKPDPDALRTLLHEVLPFTAEHSGPSSADVLHLLHAERRRRHRSRWNTALLAGLAALLSAAFWRHSMLLTVPATAPVAQIVSVPAPLVIRQVNDEQLFALLKDTPAALVKFPDGTSRLLILDP
ncbi:MAG: hypothetical protein ABJF10_17155 [Chthoniobacter sp.]|uniref:hypothetical protein n=1 Tax=Chthoniobacter sp. TaxID=2510640 RepID=UPI0032A2876C